MKSVLLIGIFISGISYAQTNIIAAKSHANFDLSEMTDPDNFGDPLPYRTISEVKYLKDDCIVEKYVVEWGDQLIEYDTVCQHPFLQSSSFDLERLKAMYPEETKFKGFDKIQKSNEKRQKKLKKERQQNEQNSSGLIFFLIGIGGFFAFLFIPQIAKSRA
ncbi:MAG: hypothetical protein AB8B56_04950 [Crocinitomicaceae bacterium]